MLFRRACCGEHGYAAKFGSLSPSHNCEVLHTYPHMRRELFLQLVRDAIVQNRFDPPATEHQMRRQTLLKTHGAPRDAAGDAADGPANALDRRTRAFLPLGGSAGSKSGDTCERQEFDRRGRDTQRQSCFQSKRSLCNGCCRSGLGRGASIGLSATAAVHLLPVGRSPFHQLINPLRLLRLCARRTKPSGHHEQCSAATADRLMTRMRGYLRAGLE